MPKKKLAKRPLKKTPKAKKRGRRLLKGAKVRDESVDETDVAMWAELVCSHTSGKDPVEFQLEFKCLLFAAKIVAGASQRQPWKLGEDSLAEVIPEISIERLRKALDAFEYGGRE